MAEGTPFTLGGLQKEFLEAAMDSFGIYTVPLLRFTPLIQGSLQAVGCGTLVKCPHRQGILTAYHVVHAPSPPIPIGRETDEILGLIVSDRDVLHLPCRYLSERPIGKPESDEHGPDLTFIEIPVMPELATLKERKSFWNLNRDRSKDRATFVERSTLLCTMGAPSANQVKTVRGWEINLTLSRSGYFGVYFEKDVFTRGEFDYVDTPVEYLTGDNLPDSFQGVSGGGLWSFSVAAKAGLTDLKVKDPLFCGVAFYETERTDDQRTIRHHYLKSVYEKARDSICDRCSTTASRS